MTEIKSLNDRAYIINGIPYQKGETAIVVNGVLVSLVEAKNEKYVYVDRVPFTDYRDGVGGNFATLNDLFTYLTGVIML